MPLSLPYRFSTNYALNQDWKVQCSASCLLDENNIENVNQQSQDIDNSSCNVQTDISRNEVVIIIEDQWSKDEAEIPTGVTDT